MCPPFGQEYLWMHRAYRHLAVLFAKRGLHVLRFDYSGCGDSAGDLDTASVRQWVDDISLAVEEVKESGGVDCVSLVGFRLGASLACLASENRKDIRHLLLWDPVVDGKRHIAELRQMHQTWMENNLPDATASRSHNGRYFVEFDEQFEVIGFPLHDRFLAELTELNLTAASPCCTDDIIMITSRAHEASRRLREGFRERNFTVAHHFFSGSERWDASGGVDSLAVPDQLLQTIVDSVAGGSK